MKLPLMGPAREVVKAPTQLRRPSLGRRLHLLRNRRLRRRPARVRLRQRKDRAASRPAAPPASACPRRRTPPRLNLTPAVRSRLPFPRSRVLPPASEPQRHAGHPRSWKHNPHTPLSRQAPEVSAHKKPPNQTPAPYRSRLGSVPPESPVGPSHPPPTFSAVRSTVFCGLPCSGRGNKPSPLGRPRRRARVRLGAVAPEAGAWC